MVGLEDLPDDEIGRALCSSSPTRIGRKAHVVRTTWQRVAVLAEYGPTQVTLSGERAALHCVLTVVDGGKP
jgi:hypothetical protein